MGRRGEADALRMDDLGWGEIESVDEPIAAAQVDSRAEDPLRSTETRNDFDVEAGRRSQARAHSPEERDGRGRSRTTYDAPPFYKNDHQKTDFIPEKQEKNHRSESQKKTLPPQDARVILARDLRSATISPPNNYDYHDAGRDHSRVQFSQGHKISPQQQQQRHEDQNGSESYNSNGCNQIPPKSSTFNEDKNWTVPAQQGDCRSDERETSTKSGARRSISRSRREPIPHSSVVTAPAPSASKKTPRQYTADDLGFDPTKLPTSISRTSMASIPDYHHNRHFPPPRNRSPSSQGRPSSGRDHGGLAYSDNISSDSSLGTRSAPDSRDKSRNGGGAVAAAATSSENRIQQLVAATKARQKSNSPDQGILPYYEDKTRSSDFFPESQRSRPAETYRAEPTDGSYDYSQSRQQQNDNGHHNNYHQHQEEEQLSNTERQPYIKEIPENRAGYTKVAERLPFERAKPREDPSTRNYSRDVLGDRSSKGPALGWQLEGEHSELEEEDVNMGPLVERHEELLWKEDYEALQAHFYGQLKEEEQSRINGTSNNSNNGGCEVQQRITCPFCQCKFTLTASCSEPAANNNNTNTNQSTKLSSVMATSHSTSAQRE